MKKSPLVLVWALVSALAVAQPSVNSVAQSGSVAAEAQSGALRPVQILLIMPFENESKVPGIEWIGEAFPEVVANRLSSSSLQLVSRGDRLIALDRLGFPSSARPSRATVYQVAQELDADYVLMGDYHLDGNTLAIRAQLLDVGRLQLGKPITESGPLDNLINIQTALSWDVLRATGMAGRINKEQYVMQFGPIRLDALENYVRGVIASTSAEKIKYFKEAVRLDPTRALPMLQLGKTYYEARDYESAMALLAKVQPTDVYGNEAQFYYGLSALYSGQVAKAEAAFSSLATRLPLTEVYNNLGVAAARLGDHRSRTFFEKTVQIDPNEADYHFNLAVELYREGQTQGAAKELKIVMNLAPEAEAKGFLDAINSGSQMGRPPLERIKRNYDESSFRQLAAEIENATEQRLQKTDPAGRAAFRVERGRELLDQGLVGEAEKQFREAIIIDPTNAEAHAGLARVLESSKDVAAARNEAQASLRLAPSAEAYLVLARLNLADNNSVAAQQDVQRALALDPGNATAAALQNDIAGGRTGKTRPPQP